METFDIAVLKTEIEDCAGKAKGMKLESVNVVPSAKGTRFLVEVNGKKVASVISRKKGIPVYLSKYKPGFSTITLKDRVQDYGLAGWMIIFELREVRKAANVIIQHYMDLEKFDRASKGV